MALVSESPAQTEEWGERLAKALPIGTLIALQGDLATGKTCLVRGMARAFTADDLVHSPTFTLVNRYGVGPFLYHLDLYRLQGPEEVLDLGFEELMAPDGLCVVEWAERAEPLLPADCLRIELAHLDQQRRHLSWHTKNAGLAAIAADILRTTP